MIARIGLHSGRPVRSTFLQKGYYFIIIGHFSLFVSSGGISESGCQGVGTPLAGPAWQLSVGRGLVGPRWGRRTVPVSGCGGGGCVPVWVTVGDGSASGGIGVRVLVAVRVGVRVTVGVFLWLVLIALNMTGPALQGLG